MAWADLRSPQHAPGPARAEVPSNPELLPPGRGVTPAPRPPGSPTVNQLGSRQGLGGPGARGRGAEIGGRVRGAGAAVAWSPPGGLSPDGDPHSHPALLPSPKPALRILEEKDRSTGRPLLPAGALALTCRSSSGTTSRWRYTRRCSGRAGFHGGQGPQFCQRCSEAGSGTAPKPHAGLRAGSLDPTPPHPGPATAGPAQDAEVTLQLWSAWRPPASCPRSLCPGPEPARPSFPQGPQGQGPHPPEAPRHPAFPVL